MDIYNYSKNNIDITIRAKTLISISEFFKTDIDNVIVNFWDIYNNPAPSINIINPNYEDVEFKYSILVL